MIMRIVLAIVVILVVLIGGVLIYAATRPDTLRVERAISIDAPPEAIYPLIENFHNWGSWSPYEKLDPDMQRTYSGAEEGEGAVYEWAGDANVGKGRMEILETSPGENVKIQLDFFEPMEGHNTAEFTLEPTGEATNVTWAMYGPNQFLGKLIGIFIDMDQMIGNDFEAGLENMKTVAEQQPQDAPSKPDAEDAQEPGIPAPATAPDA